jgi:hypothetical protein
MFAEGLTPRPELENPTPGIREQPRPGADIAKLAVNIRLPPLPGIDRIPHLTNSSMMGVDFLPRHGPLLLLAVS